MNSDIFQTLISLNPLLQVAVLIVIWFLLNVVLGIILYLPHYLYEKLSENIRSGYCKVRKSVGTLKLNRIVHSDDNLVALEKENTLVLRYDEGWCKFVLLHNQQIQTWVVVADARYYLHAEIAKHFGITNKIGTQEGWRVCGGGYIDVHLSRREILVYGSSQGYGAPNYDLVVQILKSTFTHWSWSIKHQFPADNPEWAACDKLTCMPPYYLLAMQQTRPE